MFNFKKSLSAIMSALAISVTGITTAASAEGSTNVDIASESLAFELDNVALTSGEPDIGYADGSYFSKKSTGCDCHTSYYNPCKENNACDCINYAGSIQCMAFAKYCHSICNGTKESDLTDIKGDRVSVTLTSNNLLSYLTKIGTHAYLRNDSHSVFVVSYSGSFVTFYDANYGGKSVLWSKQLY